MAEESYRMNKTHFSVAALSDESDEKQFWKSASPEERIRALEFLREIMYGYDPTTARLQRVLEITQLGKS
jgi:hypothetical protein